MIETSMGRLDAMQNLISGYNSETDVLNDLSRHALTVLTNAHAAAYNTDKCDLMHQLVADFSCHYSKIARRLQIKGRTMTSSEIHCCSFISEEMVIPQLLSLISEMRDCLLSGINVMSIGDKHILGEIAAKLDDTIYCLSECLMNDDE